MILDGEDHPLVGRRIRLLSKMINSNSTWMPEEEGMSAGLEGTITLVNMDGPKEWHQIGVAWDNGRRLMLLPGVDNYVVLPKEEGAASVS